MITIHRKVPCATYILLTVGVKPFMKSFLPGMNHVSDAEYKALRENEQFKSEISCGNMMVSSHVESETTTAIEEESTKSRFVKLAEEMHSMSAADAKKAISETLDPRILKELKKLDARKGVQESLEKQLKSIETQEHSDLTPESIPAPKGDGSNFMDKVKGSKEEADGEVGFSAIPALDTEEKF